MSASLLRALIAPVVTPHANAQLPLQREQGNEKSLVEMYKKLFPFINSTPLCFSLTRPLDHHFTLVKINSEVPRAF